MKVWVLMEADYGGSRVRGVYKTEADADAAAEAFQKVHAEKHGFEYVCEKRVVETESLIQYRPGLEFWVSGWDV